MKKTWAVLLVYFAIVHAAAGDFAVRYEGMSLSTVQTLLQTTYGRPFDFVTEDQYQAFLDAHDPLKGS